MRELRDDSLIDMKYMTGDSGFTSKYFYSQIKAGKLNPPVKLGRTSRWPLSEYKKWKDLYINPENPKN